MQKSLTFGRLTVVALFAVAALIIGISTAFAAAPNWDTTGSYEVAFTCTVGCSGTYNHDLTLSQDGSGNLTGSGGNPVGAHVYNWTVMSGIIDADAINFTANYTSTADAVTPQTTMNVVGTIVGGSMSGTWTDNYQGGARSGTWATVSGTAAPITVTPTTVVVTGDTSAGENQEGWLFNRDTSTETPFSFQAGNASIGSGSLFVPAITNTVDGNSDKFVGELFLLDPLSGLNSISYDFKIASTGVIANKDHFYMSVYANFGESAPTKFYDCRYSVVPTTGVVDGYTTVTFDPTQTYPVTQRVDSPHTCPASPSGMDALDVGSPTLRMVALNVGDTSGSDTGISGYLDKVVVNTDSSITTYDFEPAAAPAPGSIVVTKYSCPDGTPVTRTTNGVGGTVPAGCAVQSGATFGYVHGSQIDANAPFPELSAPLTAAGTTNGSGVLTINNLAADGRYLVVETNGSNQQLPAGDILGLYCQGDGDTSGTNDNQELTFVTPGGTVNCIAYNKAAPAVVVPTPVHVSPADNSTLTTAAWDKADWTDVADAFPPMTYRYESSNSSATNPDGSFITPAYQSGVLAVSEIPTAGTPDGIWYWHVRAVDNNSNTSPWTTAWKVTVDNTPPVSPVPPANACATPGTAPAGYTLQNGTSGNNTVVLAPNTMFVGKGGNDKVSGGDGNYIVCLGNGNDQVTLGNGNSTIDAGGGNNTVTVGNGEGTIKAANGNDTVVAGDGARTIAVGGGNNKVTSGDQAQTITAGAGNDEIKAGGGDDTVNAGGGNNKVWGEAGADMLTSAAGNDMLDGGADTDTCQAGGGNNTKISCEL